MNEMRYDLDKADYKELQGRYAMKIMCPGRKYDFTSPKFEHYDALSTGKTTCVEEYKAYNDPKHPRMHNKFRDYQLDFDKLRQVVKKSRNDNRTPLLPVFFTDKLLVWDLDKAGWENTAEWVFGNKEGVRFGEKEWDLQAHLFFDKGVVYKKDIPDGFWDIVNAEIEKDYPGLREQLYGEE